MNQGHNDHEYTYSGVQFELVTLTALVIPVLHDINSVGGVGFPWAASFFNMELVIIFRSYLVRKYVPRRPKLSGEKPWSCTTNLMAKLGSTTFHTKQLHTPC